MLQLQSWRTLCTRLPKPKKGTATYIWRGQGPLWTNGRSAERLQRDCQKDKRTEGFSQCNSVKAPPLKLHNKFELLYTLDSDSSSNNSVDTGRSTLYVPWSSKGASPIKERGTKQKQACLISCKINYFIVAHFVSQFISKLRGRVYPKWYFVRTIWAKPEIMVKVGLQTMNTHCLMDVNVLLNSGTTGMFIDKKFAEYKNIYATFRLPDPSV